MSEPPFRQVTDEFQRRRGSEPASRLKRGAVDIDHLDVAVDGQPEPLSLVLNGNQHPNRISRDQFLFVTPEQTERPTSTPEVADTVADINPVLVIEGADRGNERTARCSARFHPSTYRPSRSSGS